MRPLTQKTSAKSASAWKNKQGRDKSVRSESNFVSSGEESVSGEENVSVDFKSVDTGDSDVEENEEDEDGVDIDAPRIAQWEPEDDIPDLSQSSDGSLDDGAGPSKSGLNGLKGNLSSMSFQTLLRARKVLENAQDDSSSDTSETDGEHDGSDSQRSMKDERDRSKVATTSHKKVEKRPNKHAPLEMSSKRPVSRKRQVVEVKKVNYRDPRFSPLSGELSPAVFQKRYSFLADMHKTELSTLKENLKRAKKMLRSSPRDQREEREAEVQRLERAVKRAESIVNRDQREQVERQALEKAKREEKERRRQGKGEWYMKKSAEKELLLRARHDALADKGGRLAVKKAIEKKQKKISQKEKKRRPSFASRPQRTGNADASNAPKRKILDFPSNSTKRRRTNSDAT